LQELEKISGLTSEQAKEYLIKSVEDEVKHETAVLIKELENNAKEEAERRQKNMLSLLFSVVQQIMWLNLQFP
jgi:ribonuclease Y